MIGRLKLLAMASLSILGACAYSYDRGGPELMASLRAPRPVVVDPPDNPRTPEKVALGRDLFNDPRLSGNGAQSCASCHQADRGFGDGQPLGRGADGRALVRHTPTLWNIGFAARLFSDGRAASLEEQALMPITNGAEMGRHPGTSIDPIQADPDYRRRFARAFPDAPETSELNVAKALAAYQRTLVSPDTPYDRWARGDAAALSPAARRGFQLFVGRGGCAQCHSGPNFTDGRFHDVGLPDADLGRGAITGKRAHDHAFRTPGLREVSRTAPYMHDGSLPSLEAVVDHYSDHVTPRRTAPPARRLSPAEKADLVAFLLTLSADEPTAARAGRLVPPATGP